MYKLTKNRPIPTMRGRQTYPFPRMEVGDSFHLPVEGDKRQSQNRISAAAWGWARKRGAKFATRQDDTGVRVWRIA